MTAHDEPAAEHSLRVAAALSDPAVVATAVTPAAAVSLCEGLSGTALLHACLARAHPPSAQTAALHWNAAASLLHGQPPAGIYTGRGALAASLIIGSGYLPDPEPHHTATNRAVVWLAARAEGLAHYQKHRTARANPTTPWAVYDVINGLAGIGRVLLAAHTAGHQAARRGLTAALATLTTMIGTPHGPRPGWWLPARDHPPPVRVPASGAATTGLAHGIAGPIALLSISHAAGHTVPGQRDAIRTAAEWLLTRHETDTASWPPYISGSDLDRPGLHAPTTGRRYAWCYGSPGIGRALTTAGHALADAHVADAGRPGAPRP